MRKKKKKTELEKVQDKLWDKTSEYSRRKDADQHTGYVSCVTCGKTAHWKEMQAGHFIPKSKGGYYRWCLGNIFAQCMGCNYGFYNNYRKGTVANETARIRYTRYMETRFGVDYVDYLLDESDKKREYKIWDLEERIVYLDKLLEALDG